MKALLEKYTWLKYACLVFSGVLMSLTLIFPVIGVLEWLAMIPAAAAFLHLAADRRVKYKTMYRYGFVYFMSFYVTSFHWFIALYPLSFIDGMTKPAALLIVFLGCVGLSFLQTLASAFVPVLLAVAVRRTRFTACVPVCAAAIYTVFEWMQTLTWAGVPWARLAIGQTESAVMLKTVSLFGSYFLTFLIVAVNFFLGAALISDKINYKKISVAVSAALIAVNAVLGAVLIASEPQNASVFKAAAIQPNISSQEKWSNELILTEERVEKYCIDAAKEGAELIVLSETVFPYDALESNYIREFIASLAKRCDATLVVGCFTTNDESVSQNSLIFVSPDGEFSDKIYSKRHLVPFGEYVPWRALIMTLIPPLAEISMLGDDLAPGDGSAVYDSDLGRLGGLICFDSIYENLTLATVRDGAEIIVIGTNDSWFSDSAAASMHNAQSRIRAVESGRYFVRSANTGISSIIDYNGEVLDLEPALIEGYAIAEISPRDGRTLYSYIGNLLVWLSAAIFAVFVACRKKTNCE